MDWAHPEIEYVWPEGPSPGTWTGRRAMGESWREYVNAWQDLRTAVDAYRELDSERVLVLARFQGRGRTSGLDLGQVGTQGAYLFQIDDGKVTRLVGYWSRDRRARRPRPGGVGDVAGEVMTPWASPATDEMGESLAAQP